MVNVVSLLSELLRFRSLTPSGVEIIDYLYDFLRKYGFTCTKIDSGNVHNIYAKVGNGKPCLAFAGHVDVVPVGNPQSWKYDPFGAVVNDGIIYGRGVVDMKGAIAAFITAAIQILPKISSGSIALIISGDEEGKYFQDGTPKILQWMKDNNENVDFCLVGEPTCSKTLGDTVKVGRRGVINFTLTCYGVQGHVAYPQLADNPIDYMARILASLVSLRLDNGNEHFEPSNCEVVSVDTGNTVFNVIPEKITAKINIRFNNEFTAEELVSIIDDICKRETLNYDLQYTVSGDAFLCADSVVTRILATTIREVLHIQPEYSTSGGTSDARFIKDVCDVAEFGMLHQTAHKVDESAPIDDLIKLTEVYSRFCLNFFKNR